MTERHLLRVEIDHRPVDVPEGTTVLRAAELAGVPVPSLCSHPELSPFGGCRLCTVEIAGLRGYPLACSTSVQDGMEVATDTVALREMHREVLELILSQHPSSCLVCDERDDCRRNQQTIRKAGVSTGCRSCPRDGVCELQRVAELVGVTDIGYPVAYRGLDVEHDDPFFDRDYNLCILCGRCVRMCQEVRGTAVLAFHHRGPHTLIGPAFGSSHVAAGCEFCGACVSVCPTGALADKVSKWDGAPDGVEHSTCPFCGVGCRLALGHKDGRLSAAGAVDDDGVADGQLCLRGRFCLPETTHHAARARRPMLRRGRYFREVAWDEALDEVADVLASTPPDESLTLVSSDLTNEALYAARRFVREGLGSGGLDSTGRDQLAGGPALWSRLFALPVSIAGVARAGMVVVAGLDPRFSFSVVGVQVRRALRRGARLVVVDARESGLALAADRWLRVAPGGEALRLRDELPTLQPPAVAEDLAIVIGPRVFEAPGADALVDELDALVADREAEGATVTVVPLAHGANVRGLLELGLLEGGEGARGVRAGSGALGTAARRGARARRRPLDLAALRAGRRPRVLHLVGEAPFTARPDCEFLIAQDLYLPPFEVDAFLPAASFAEAAGTLTSLEGRVQEVRPVEPVKTAPRSTPLPDWLIFSELADRLELADLQYPGVTAVRDAIRAELPEWPAEDDRSRRRPARPAGAGRASRPSRGPGRAPFKAADLPGRGRFVLVPEPSAFRHRGIDLADVVEGLGELGLERGLRMSPSDLDHLGVGPGGEVTVALDGTEIVLAARPDPACPRGAAYVTRDAGWSAPSGPVRVRIRARGQGAT